VVEVSGHQLTRSRIPLYDFERSEDGQRLAADLSRAVKEASLDA
jgi:hypothetical protein